MMKSFKKQIFSLCILIISISYYEVIHKPFPFINMTYTNSIEQVNDFSFNEFDSYEFRNIDLSTAVSMSDFQKITWAVEKSRNLQDLSNGNLIRQKENMFDENRSYLNICSENSKILSSLLYELNFPNRIIWMDGFCLVIMGILSLSRPWLGRPHRNKYCPQVVSPNLGFRSVIV